MTVQRRTLLAAALAAALTSGAAAQDAAPASPADAPAAAATAPGAPAAPPPVDDETFGSKQPAPLPPIPKLEPEPLPSVEPPAEENVWSHGVPQEQRVAADALFQEGNKLLRESLTILAVSKYREALGHWDHPNIHFNLGIALMALDQPVETYEHLQLATKYGAKPLEEERFQHARNYMILLEKQLARVKVGCDVPQGLVELDGHQLFTTPGEWNGLVRAGRHTLVARRDGYVTNQSVRIWEGGQTVAVRLDLKTADELTERTRRWSAWKPWALVVGGAAAIAGGVVSTNGGNQKIGKYDRLATDHCTPPPGTNQPVGCFSGEPPDLAKMRKDGQKLQTMGVAGYAVGGAAFVTGVVLVVMNRGVSHVRAYDSGEASPALPAQPKVEISPLVTPDVPGLTVRVHF